MAKLVIEVAGRAAPSGSFRPARTRSGMRNVSKYLPAWKASIKRAVFAALDEGASWKYLSKPNPIILGGYFRVPNYHNFKAEYCTEKPDKDKVIRAVQDALTETGVVWQDDCQVVGYGPGPYFRWTKEGEEDGGRIIIRTPTKAELKHLT